jgi:hypothetical protein
VRYERLRRLSKLAADLELPNIYTMAERYQAEDRWHQLHPLAAEVYEGTRLHREEAHPPKEASVFVDRRQAHLYGPDSALCYRIAVSKTLDESVLSNAIEQLVRYNEILQARLEDGKYVFVSANEAVPSGKVLSVFFYDGPPDDRENFNREIIKELSALLTARRSGSIRIALVHDNRAACELFFVVQRTMVDARGLVLLCEDLFRIYEQLLHDKPISLRTYKPYSSIVSELAATAVSSAEQSAPEVNTSEASCFEEGGDSRAFSVLFDPVLSERVLDAKFGAFELKPAETLAASLLKMLRREESGEHFEVDVRTDYRNRDENLSQTVGALTTTCELRDENVRSDDLLSRLKFVRRTLKNLDLPNREAELSKSPAVNGKRVFLNLEYCIESPWLGGVDWTPQGFVEDTRLADGYVLELMPVVFGEGIRVWFKHRDEPELRRLAEALAKDAPAITEEMLELRNRYIEMQEFWHNEFGRDASQSNLEIATDGGYPGGSSGFERKPLSGECLMTVKEIAEKCETSASLVMLAAFSVLLSRLNGREDLVLVYARDTVDDPEVVPLRLVLSWQHNFKEFLGTVQMKRTKSLENGAFSFEFLTAGTMNAEHGLAAPSFDVAFIQNQSAGSITAERLTELVPQIGGELKLALEMTESSGQFSLSFAYRNVQREIVAQLETWLNALVSDVARNIEKRIGEIALEDGAALAVPDDFYGRQFSF